MSAPHAAPPVGPPHGGVQTANRPPQPGEGAPPLGARLRDWADEALFQSRRFLEESWQDFRRRDRFFRWKAAIVAAWTALSIVSLGIATSGPADPASNGIGAYVARTQTSMGWGLLLHNRSGESWTRVRVELPGGWSHERASVAPDEKVVLGPGQFVRGALAAPADLRFEEVRVITGQGSASPRVVH